MAEKSNGFVPITAVLNDPEKLAEAIKERQALAKAKKEAKERATATSAKVENSKAPVVRLPVEVQEHRAAPNICLRSALFGVMERGRRQWLRDAVIAAQDGYRVIYTGEQLDQSDLDVWLAVKHLCAPYPLGTEVRFTAPQLFKLLGRSDGKQSREWLKRVLKRLKEGAVSLLNPGGGGFQGSLIDWWAWDNDAYEFVVILSPRMAPLFGQDSYTLVDIEQRQQLHRELSRWLHCYWSSHDKIYPIKDTTLMELCGARFERTRDFRSKLRRALQELEMARFLKSGWDVARNGLVTATKAPTSKVLRRTLRKLRKSKRKGDG